MTMLLGGSNTGVSLAMSAAAKEKKIPFFAIGAAAASLTGKDCTPYTIHYGYDTTALANGTAKTILEEGGKSWFFLTADYAFGKQLEAGATEVVKAGGGSVVGDVRVPLGTSDFSSFLLQAQGSGAKVLGLANAGADTSKLTQGCVGVRPDQDDEARGAAGVPHRRPRGRSRHCARAGADDRLVLEHERHHAGLRQSLLRKDQEDADLLPGGLYSATLTYLNAVKAVGSTDSDKVMEQLHKTKINDMFVKDAAIRADGLLEHDMYIVQVKTPAELKGDWDFYKILKTMKGDEAFGKLADSTCPLVKK